MSQPLRAAIYARFSTDMQRDASIEDQIRTCKDYPKQQGLQIVGEYTDRATSGASLMRSGIQKLQRDASTDPFDVVISEALDRLSRNQADIAQLFQRLVFSNVAIETVSEGCISEMHIGLKGTMNALFLKDLAKKTHRGQKGRALAGKSAGGKAYGYKVVQKFDEAGDPVRGDRSIDPAEAKIVKRIFQEYAAGRSPKKIAEALNKDRIPSPSGRGWGASTLHGNRERGTGILNNELYIGRQVWNRLQYVKDPDTGKRTSRLNPPEDWVITEVPGLRIIPQDLWDAAKIRQSSLKVKGTKANSWDRRRPRTLFSGLIKCAACGGGYAKISKDHFGCSTARNKGASICNNKLSIHQQTLERLVFRGLDQLMDEEALDIFCQEYIKERNRLNAEASAGRSDLEQELIKTKREHARLVDAIVAGVPADQVKDRMIALEDHRKTLEEALQKDPAPAKLRLHPGMATTYRDRLQTLVRDLDQTDRCEGSKEALRGLIDRIVLHPSSKTGKLSVELEGALAGLLALADSNAPIASKGHSTLCDDTDIIEDLVLVAGA